MAAVSPLFVDLHCHTTFSHDGWQSPEAVVRAAAERGAQIFSVTDHNQIGSQAQAKAEAQRLGIPYLTGVELDLIDPVSGKQFHCLAYGFDPEHPAMRALIERQLDCYARESRAILDAFAAAGMKLDEAALREWLPVRYEGNPQPPLVHRSIGEWAVLQGLIPDRNAFKAWMARNTFPRTFASLPDGLEAVHAAGGVLLVAHIARSFPGDSEQQLHHLRSMLEMGADGFELYHPFNLADPGMPALEAMAREMDCLLSCGSDTHRIPLRDGTLFGRVPVPDWVIDRLPQAPALLRS